jgi:hypothetical protein
MFDLFTKWFGKGIIARKDKRFKVVNGGSLVIITGDVEREVRIIDISSGGMAFVYPGPVEDLRINGAIKSSNYIPMEEEPIQFHILSKRTAPYDDTFCIGHAQFTWFGRFGKSQINEFMTKYGISV